MQRMLEYFYTFCVCVRVQMYIYSKIKMSKIEEEGFQGRLCHKLQQVLHKYERINQTELKKYIFSSGAKKMEKGTFEILHDYLNLGQVDAYLKLIVK